MLRHLYIQGFTLIDKLDIEIKSGFTVITGETGAGKSIVLGALGLLLGNRADAKSIKTGCDKCIIEATFNLSGYNLKETFDNLEIDYDEEECIIRREIKSHHKKVHTRCKGVFKLAWRSCNKTGSGHKIQGSS